MRAPCAFGRDHGVELAEEHGVGREMRFQECARGLVVGIRADEPMPREETTCPGIGHGHGTVGRVEQDRVDGLRAEAWDRQHLGAERCQRRTPQGVKSAVEAAEQPRGEDAQASGDQGRRVGRAQRGAQLPLGRRHEAAGIEQASFAERRDGAHSVGRCRVLGEDRAQRDLVRAPARPPALRAVTALQRHVQPQQARLDGVPRRAGNTPPPREDG
jgi:hypothetical protein